MRAQGPPHGERFALDAAIVKALGEARGKPVCLHGVVPEALGFVAPLLGRLLGCPIAFVVATRDDAEALVHDALFFAERLAAPLAAPVLLPALEPDPYLGVPPHLQVVVDRANVLHATLSGGPRAVVLPAEAVAQRLPPPEVFRALASAVHVGEALDRDAFARALMRAGYRRQDMVGSIGELSVRGGIVDVFSPAAPAPYRIELLGDVVESIRRFDPVTQRSEDNIAEAVLLPLVSFPIPEDADARLRAWGTTLPETALPDLRAAREELRTRGTLTCLERFLPALVDERSDILAYLPGYAIVLIEPTAIHAAIEKRWASYLALHQEATTRGTALPPPEALALTPDEARARLGHAKLELSALSSGPGGISLHTQPARRFEGRIRDLVGELASDREQGLDGVVVLPSQAEAERVEAMLSEYDIPYLEGDRAQAVWSDAEVAPAPGRARIAVATGRLARGFRAPGFHLSVHSAPEVFGGVLQPARRRRARAAAFASDFRDLKVGDHVVHVDHGIGRFQGLKSVTVGDVTREFMVLAYAGDDRLYVPLDRLDLVEKHSGVEGAAPRIDSLGGTAWARVKKKVKADLLEMANELLRLYATRRAVSGHSFAPDGLFQKEFEDAFPFVETPDQATAIADIKRDMESPRCMDRLLCGDVGYGKTEVAMRAAFKAVADGKQVAVLAPTTILAFQHHRTFRERFHAFPIVVELTSRFQSAKATSDILTRLAEGKVDVLIGTHKLLSTQVQFRDLGLLIVDEEQRFGVGHKEKLKQMRAGIDVLTLSATPIPRTLQMSLAGLRDMSVIETPPKDRLAIETEVLHFQGSVIKEGILREMERGGQVYFVHNRVESIGAMATTLHKIAPFARVVVAHGQMREKQLEEAMQTFVDRGADILLATTIIENGLDLPNVNTIFINRAHRLGLAQLYQLRGRVGRSDRPAYAFLLIPNHDELSPAAAKRLHAIQEFTDLGSGFRIAALDLEIRGAGNVLGREQHGHISAIGFDLYMELLEQAVRELQGEAAPVAPTQVSLGLDLHVPEDYVADVNQRLMVYKRIAAIQRLEEVDEMGRELTDRFGPTPPPLESLLAVARLRLEAQALGITSIDREGARVVLRVGSLGRIDPQSAGRFVQAAPKRKLHPDGRIELGITSAQGAIDEIRLALLELT